MKYLFLIASIALFLSCTFKTSINADLPRENPQIVLNSVIRPDSVLKVDVTLSKSILDNRDYTTVLNAEVIVTTDDGLRMVLPLQKDRSYYLPDFKAHENVNYSLQVNVPGYESATSSTTIPARVDILKIEKGNTLEIAAGEYVLTYWLYFQDPPDEKNYYSIDVFRINTNYYTHRSDTTLVSIKSVDQSTFSSTPDKPDLLFNDILDNGQSNKISVLIGFGSSKLLFRLKTVSEDLYLYEQTKELQESNRDDPFAEPVMIHNNITNGLGVFGGYSDSVVSFEK